MTATNWIGGSGEWGDAANWSAGVPDGTSVATLGDTGAYSASIDAGDSFSIGTLNITGPHAVFEFYGTLNVNSAINLSDGNFVLAGTIVGGEIRQTGGSITFAGTPLRANNPYPGADGTLDGVKFVGPMNFANDTAVVNIKDGLTVTGSDGTSPGVMNMTGSDAQINFYGSQTFDNATVNIGGNGLYSYLLAYDDNGAAATLTLGPNLDLIAKTGNVYFGGNSDATIVNQGTIKAGLSGKFFEVYSLFANQGTVDISNGQVFSINTSNFKNTGTVNVTSGAVLLLEGNQVGSQLGNIHVNGGLVRFDGTLDNSGNVLSVGTRSALGAIQLWGTIHSGTIRDGGSGISYWGSKATLDGVSYRGTISIGGGGFTVINGITLQNLAGTGPGKLAIGGGQVLMQGTQTLDNATVVLGGAQTGSLQAEAVSGGSATLTFGAGLTLATDGYGSLGSDNTTTLVNQGRILVQAAGDQLNISASSFTNSGTIAIANGDTLRMDSPNFVNTGKITVTGGATLQLWNTYSAGGSYATANLGSIKVSNGGMVAIEGRLENNAALLRVDGANALGKVTLAGEIDDGTILDSGAGFTFANGILGHVKYRGTMALDTDNARVQIYGITLTGTNGTGKGAIDVTGGSAEVAFYGTQTVSNATITLGADNGSAPATLGAYNIPGATTASTLTLGAGLTVVTGGVDADLTGDGRLVNRGSVIADTVDGTLTITAATFVNANAFIVGNGEAVVDAAAFANNGAVEVIDGTLELAKALTGTGSVQIDAAGTVTADSAVGNGQWVQFYGAGGTLNILAAASFAAGIGGFGEGDTIDLRNVAFGSTTTVHYAGDADGGTLTVSDGTHTAKLRLIGNYTSGSFADASDGSRFTQITFTPSAAAARTATSPGTGDSRLHQFLSAISAHSADGAGFHAAHTAQPLGEPVDRALAASALH